MSDLENSLGNQLCVVTGAGGFIASHLVEALLSRGARVRALVHYNALGAVGHLRDATSRSGSDRLEIVAGDVRDGRCMRELVTGAHVVFHLAALIGIPYSYVAPESYVDTNVKGTLNVLEACRDAGVSRVLHTSTSEVYGTARMVPMDEAHPLQAQSPYAATKIAADKLAESYFLSFQVPVTTVRPFNTYGPRHSLRGVLPTILSQALSDTCDRIELGSLDPVRDLTYVTDTANAYCEIAGAPLETVAGRVYNLGTGHGVSIGDLAKMALRAAGIDKPVVSRTERRRPEASEVMRLISNPARVEAEVGWKAAVSLDEGLRRTVKWLKMHPADERPVDHYAI
ncbi:GDP-mannose 4,6-dehydratase [bacterium]|nr:GDP-mannose 4,6-dehydratase [bacterium]